MRGKKPNNTGAGKLRFSSVVRKGSQKTLESLLFFNEQQGRFTENIIRSIDEYGIPEITVDGELLRINVGAYNDIQSLFAFDGDHDEANLIGLVVYFRNKVDNITVLHIAVDEQYSSRGEFYDQMLALQLINRVREVGRLIKGVKTLSIAYNGDFNSVNTLPVKEANTL